jgi:enoyl-CoA hydratase/carnithine racemase
VTATTAAGPAITTTVHGGVGTIEISNPDRRNALSVSMMFDLADTVHALNSDADVRVVVLRGAGEEAFVSGADLSEFGGRTQEAQQHSDQASESMFARLSEVSVPLIARIHGYCLGAGVAIALNADLRCADTRAVLSIPAARLGIGYPLAQTADLVHTVGPSAAADLLYTGRRVPAVEAQALGLLDRVVETEGLGEVVDELAATIAGNAPLSVRAAKAAIRSVRRTTESAPDHDEIRRGALAEIARCGTSGDLREGTAAFLEKRAPRFTGR